MSKSTLEAELAMQIKALGLPEPIREYPAIKGRKFQFDFAWLEQKVLVEVNGGTYQRMGHSTGAGISRDYEKHNLATLAGWRVLAFDRKMVESGEAIQLLQTIFTTEEKN